MVLFKFLSRFSHFITVRAFTALIIALLVVGTVPVKPAHALACAAIANGSWNSPATWSCTAVPGIGDSVTIGTPFIVTLAGNESAMNVTITTGGTLTLASFTLTLSSASTGMIVNNGGILNAGMGIVADNAIGAPFTLASGGTLQTANPQGISTGVVLAGSIQTRGVRTYTAGANYVYNGTVNQSVGNGLTQNIPRNLTINNPGNTVSLGAATTISGSLIMTAGTLSLAANTTVGDVQGAANITKNIAGAATLTTGSNNASTTYSGIISNGIGTVALTKVGTGVLTLSGNSTYSGITTLILGTININSATAIGSGTFTITAGTINNTSGAAITLSNNNPMNWNGNFTFTGTNPLNLGTGVVALNANRTITVTANTLTVGGVIGGAFRLTKAGNGALTLNGVNTHSGTTLTAGLINIGNAQAFGNVASVINLNGGSINNTTGAALTTLNYAYSIGGNVTFVGTNNLNLGTGTITLTGNRTLTVTANTLIADGVIGGAFGLTKAGNGFLTLNASNTHSGTTLTAGTLNIGNAQALGNIANAFIINGGSINNTTGAALTLSNYPYTVGGNFTFVGTNNLNLGSGIVTLTGNRTITVTANTLTVNGVIGGAFSLTKAGNGTLTLNAANTHNGTTLTAGVLNIGNAQALGTVPGTFTINGGTIDNSTGAALTLLNYPQTWGGNFTFAGTNNLNMGSGVITLTAARTVTTTANTLTVGGVVGGAFRLTKAGAGTLSLSGVNTFSGTTLSAGILNINNVQALGAVSGAFIITAGTIDNTSGAAVTTLNYPQNWNGNFTFAGTNALNLGTGAVTMNAARTVTTTANTLTVGGVIGGAFRLTKAGAGILTLSGANTFTGTTLSAGTLNINNAQALGAVGGAFIITGGTIDNTSGATITTLNYPQNWNGNFTFTGTNNLNLGTGAVAMNAARTITISANTLSVGGVVSGAFRLTKDGSGALTLSGTNTFTGGTTLTAGTLNVNNPQALGTVAGTLIINGGAIDNTSGAAITTLNYPQTWGGNFVFTGTNNLNLGTGAVTLSASRTVTVNANTLTVGGTVSPNTTDLTKAGGGTLSFGSNAVSLRSLVISAGTLVSTSGTMNLAGNFTNSSVFTHNSGTVNFNGAVAQSINGTTTFNNLTLNNANGLTINVNETVNSVLTLTNGRIATGANILIIETNGSIVGAAAARYINGLVQKNFPVAAGQNFSFPIGNAATYAPVDLTGLNVTTTGGIIASTTTGEHPNIATSNIDPAKDVNRYWTLAPAGGLVFTPPYNATFNFVPGDLDGGATTANFIVNRYSSGWSPPVPGARTATSTQATSIAGLGDFVVGELGSYPPTITSAAPPSGTVNNNTYAHLYTATGSTPITYSLTSGSLPPGLNLTPAGSLSGTPTTAGTYSGIVTAANGVIPDAPQNFSITINPASTTTTITNDTPDPSVVGEAVTINFTVTGAFGNLPTVPTGNVIISDGTQSCTATIAIGTCSITFTSPGIKSLTATYIGDANFNGSASAIESHTVNAANTTTNITNDTPDPSVVGEAVSVNYSVSVTAPGAGIPTGNVTVSDGIDSCTATVAAGTCSITFTSPGSKSLTATYAGDANFNSSSSVIENHTVNAANTTTIILSDTPDPSVVGEAVIVNYSVPVTAPGAGTPTGNVTISDGIDSCTATVAAGSCLLTFTSPGAKSLTATYSGDANFNGSTSVIESHTVNVANTTISILSDTPNPSVVGEAVVVNYSVSVIAPGSGTPSGNVTISDGTDSCTATVSAGTCTITYTSAGVKSLTATYTGDVNFNASSSTTAGHTVNAADTATAISSDSPDPSVVGEAVIVNYSVSVTAPGSGTPTGNVTISDGTDSCTATVSAGTCTITFTSAGAKVLTAAYTGDVNFNGSSSVTEGHTVNAANTTITITSDIPDPSAGGQVVVVQYSVIVSGPGAGTPTGNVAVSDGVNSCIASIAAGQCNITLATDGVRTLIATYAGDANFNSSISAGEPHVVDATAPSITSINRTGGDPTNATSVSFTVLFSESVTGVNASNFSLTTTGGISGASITSVSAGPGSTRTVNVNTGSGDGTIGLNLINNTGIADILGNALGAGSFTGQTYTIIKSTPTVSIGAPSSPATGSGPIDFPVTITGASSVNLTSVDITLNTTGTATGIINVTNGTTNSPTVTISAISGDGTISITIAAGVASDSVVPVPNINSVTGPSVPFIVDNTAPQISANGIGTAAGVLTDFQILTSNINFITVSFSKDVYDDPTDTVSYNDDATNPANYLLVRDNQNDGIQTSSCTAGIVSPSDIGINVDAVSYSNGGGSGPFVSTLTINSGLPLSNGQYRLLVCGTTSIGSALNPNLSLAGDGINSGTDFPVNFRIAIPSGNSGGGNPSVVKNIFGSGNLLIPVTGFSPNKVTLLPIQPASSAYSLAKGLEIEIPSLGVRLPIVGVQLNKSGWDIKWLGNSAGYLEGSAYPTLSGNSVITGHVTDANGKPGPFAYINELKENDLVVIHFEGQQYIYQIREDFLVNDKNVQAVFKHEEYQWITLVTCETYSEKLEKFLYRRLVRAVLISVIPEK